jgi:hypothetical protein
MLLAKKYFAATLVVQIDAGAKILRSARDTNLMWSTNVTTEIDAIRAACG